MRTIIAGSRDGVSYENVVEAMAQCGWTPTVVISGTARGADRMGEAWAQANGIDVERFPAQWDLYGRHAGIMRNQVMARKAEALVAIWDGESRGTAHMIACATQRELRVYVHRIRRVPTADLLTL